MEKSNSVVWKLLICVAEILAGILLLTNPEGFITTIVRVGSIVLIIMGIWSIIQYFRTPVEEAAGKNGLIRGLLFLLLGILLLCNAAQFTLGLTLFGLPFMALLFAIDLLVMGFLKLQTVFDMMRMKNGHWPLMLISVILSIVLGLLLLFRPFGLIGIIWMFTGISLIVEGVMDGVMAFVK